MRKIISFLFLFMPFCVSAYDFCIDGIYYNIYSNTKLECGVAYTEQGYCGDITIPSTVLYNGDSYTVRSIDDWTFSGCNKLTSVIIPNTVTYIGYEAFLECSNLTEIFIPASVANISIGIFTCCNNLTSISVSTDNPIYDSRDNCNAIIKTNTNTIVTGCQNTIIPQSVVSIGESSFSGCTNLNSITIPNSVEKIGDKAFFGCGNLTSISIPFSVKFIGKEAFYYCNQLNVVRCEAETPPTMGNESFEGISSNCTLFVPYQSLIAYRIQQTWHSAFRSINPMEEPSLYDINKDGEIDIADITMLIEYVKNQQGIKKMGE